MKSAKKSGKTNTIRVYNTLSRPGDSIASSNTSMPFSLDKKFQLFASPDNDRQTKSHKKSQNILDGKNRMNNFLLISVPQIDQDDVPGIIPSRNQGASLGLDSLFSNINNRNQIQQSNVNHTYPHSYLHTPYYPPTYTISNNVNINNSDSTIPANFNLSGIGNDYRNHLNIPGNLGNHYEMGSKHNVNQSCHIINNPINNQQALINLKNGQNRLQSQLTSTDKVSILNEQQKRQLQLYSNEKNQLLFEQKLIQRNNREKQKLRTDSIKFGTHIFDVLFNQMYRLKLSEQQQQTHEPNQYLCPYERQQRMNKKNHKKLKQIQSKYILSYQKSKSDVDRISNYYRYPQFELKFIAFFFLIDLATDERSLYKKIRGNYQMGCINPHKEETINTIIRWILDKFSGIVSYIVQQVQIDLTLNLLRIKLFCLTSNISEQIAPKLASHIICSYHKLEGGVATGLWIRTLSNNIEMRYSHTYSIDLLEINMNQQVIIYEQEFCIQLENPKLIVQCTITFRNMNLCYNHSCHYYDKKASSRLKNAQNQIECLKCMCHNKQRFKRWFSDRNSKICERASSVQIIYNQRLNIGTIILG